MKWRLAYDILCDKNVSPRLKGKRYRLVIRPALLCEVEYWPINNTHF